MYEIIMTCLVVLGFGLAFRYRMERNEAQAELARVWGEMNDRKTLVETAVEMSIATGITTNDALEMLLRAENAHIGTSKMRKLKIRR